MKQQIEQAIATIGRLEAKLDNLQRDFHVDRRRSLEMAHMQTVSLFDSTLITNTRYGFKMFIDGRDTGSGLNIVTSGQIEPHVSRVFQKLVRPGSVVLDVGANFGYYTMFGAMLAGPQGKVISFEANPNLLSFIDRSLYVNGYTPRVKVFNKAVSNEAGTAKFGFTFDGIGGGSLGKGGDTKGEVIDVSLARIDDLVDRDLIADCIKIDVEGHEFQALQGMEGLLKRSRDVALILEYFTGIGGSQRGLQIVDYLAGLGFSFWEIDGRGFLQAMSREQLAHAGDIYIVASRTRPNDREIVIDWRDMRRPQSDGQELSGDIGSVVVHGPYWPLPEGVYDIFLDGEISGAHEISATHEFGNKLASTHISNSAQSLRVAISPAVRFFEVVVRPLKSDSKIRLDRVRIVDRT
ncbi:MULTISPECIES: FkbM family methyltransferase [unclassified Beijerinckia]|uniref:FkbM family methyltransferase n=1 Tax=unclassified Beijerinckia TaxID=2638183 RepID=UPI0014812BE1|nr:MULTISPECIES: FkbM family methyltransferase [unclassified Beijerinckia]